MNTALHYATFGEERKEKEGKDTEMITTIAVFLVLSRADVTIKNAAGNAALVYGSSKLKARLSSLVEIRDNDISFLIKKAVDYK